jgi:hemin uptake protein HemP
MQSETPNQSSEQPMTSLVLSSDDTRPEHDARALTAGGVAATIRLDGQTYTLRITRMGKLILTK